MKHKITFLFVLQIFSCVLTFAQIESVFVEKYYTTDLVDASFDGPLGTQIEEGVTTYRIFVDLEAGSSLNGISGSENHPLIFESTETIYNHDFGETVGANINPAFLQFNTIALDSYLTLGKLSSNYTVVPKDTDTDGNIIAGSENSDELLNNDNPDCGIPLTTSDGLILSESTNSYTSSGLGGGDEGETIFSDNISDLSFMGTGLLIAANPVIGPTPENVIFLGQVTTSGDLSFCINLDVWVENDGNLELISYVSNDTLITEGEVFDNLLCYPQNGGCTDPNYLEYDPTVPFDDGSCTTLIVLGCMDNNACNFNSEANFNVQELCCYYPDDCYGDINIICEPLGLDNINPNEASWLLYPNPASDLLTVEIYSRIIEGVKYVISNVQGDVLLEGFVPVYYGQNILNIETSLLTNGTYILSIMKGDSIEHKRFAIIG